MANSYDDLPYDSRPLPQTHPDRLATLATLLGLNPPALPGCRVLELGCASGGNLIPLAEQIPGMEGVGVDLSASQIADGQGTIDALGYTNIRLIHASIDAIDASYGEFDFILCHGVYSWVPPDVQDAILRVCHERLKPNGIAYISYNTLPGWHMRRMVRDLMRHHALAFPSPAQQVSQARAILDFLAEAVPAENSAYGMLLRQELDSLSEAPDSYIYHEHLEAVNEPIYFRDFVSRAAQHRLKYLAESDFASMFASRLEPNVAASIRQLAPDIIGYEQMLDFVCNRAFRQSLLIHGGQPVNRTVNPEQLERLLISGNLESTNPSPNLTNDHPEAFRTLSGTSMTVRSAVTKAALLALRDVWPCALSWPDLVAKAHALLPQAPTEPSEADWRSLTNDLLQCFTAGTVFLHRLAPPVVNTVSEYPMASPLARYQARMNLPVTSLRHETVNLDEAARQTLTWMDGSLANQELQRRVREKFPRASSDAADGLIQALAKAALLRA